MFFTGPAGRLYASYYEPPFSVSPSRAQEHLEVPVVRQPPDVVERPAAEDAQLVRLGIVIDFDRVGRVVEPGSGDLIEDVAGEIARRAAQQVDERRHPREVL